MLSFSLLYYIFSRVKITDLAVSIRSKNALGEIVAEETQRPHYVISTKHRDLTDMIGRRVEIRRLSALDPQARNRAKVSIKQ